MATSKNKAAAPVEEVKPEEVKTEEQPAEAQAAADQIEKEMDPAIKALLQEIEDLKNEISILKGEDIDDGVEEEESEGYISDVWEEYEEVYVPRHGRGQEPNFFISVNDRTVQIPADGKYHRMRKPFADILRMSIEAEAAADKYAEEVPHDAAPGSFEQMMSVINDLQQKLRAHGID